LKLDEKKGIFGYWVDFVLQFAEGVASVSL
jgi:hypothetical protein